MVLEPHHIGVRLVLFVEHVLIATRSHEHEMPDMHFGDAVHAHLALGTARIGDGNRVAYLGVHHPRHTFGDDRTTVGEHLRLVPGARTQGDVVAEIVGVISGDQGNRLFVVLLAGHFRHLLVVDRRGLGDGPAPHCLGHFGALRIMFSSALVRP